MFSIEKKHYTNDAVIRRALIEHVDNQYNTAKHPGKVIEEFSVCDGAARIDLAAVNGVMHGFEIKSDIDSLERLPHQMGLYGSIFDKVTLVVGVTHLYHAFNIIPDWWGVTVARVNDDGAVYFNEIREPETNHCTEVTSVVKLLWKDEALNILEDLNLSRGYKSKNREQICNKLIDTLDAVTLTSKVRHLIQFNRQGWKVGA